jgi:hypothetical protein
MQTSTTNNPNDRSDSNRRVSLEQEGVASGESRRCKRKQNELEVEAAAVAAAATVCIPDETTSQSAVTYASDAEEEEEVDIPRTDSEHIAWIVTKTFVSGEFWRMLLLLIKALYNLVGKCSGGPIALVENRNTAFPLWC